MKYLSLICFLYISVCLHAQQPDSVSIKHLYDRCLDFSESKLDSLYYYSNYIYSASKSIGFKKGDVLSLRLKGIYYDFKGEYKKAIDYYLQSLTAAQRIDGTEYEIAALTDLAILYAHIKQPQKAKETYLQSAELSAKRGDVGSLITAYGNLGAIYNQLRQPDSALFFLHEGLRVAQPLGKKINLSVIYNNIGNVYFYKKQYARALEYFRINKGASDTSAAEAWISYLNMADVFIEMKLYDSAHIYADSALLIAKQLGSKSKESDSYALMAKLHAMRGEYKSAYEFQKNWYQLDTSLVNDETNATVAGLQEKYNSQKRQRDNDILTLELARQRLYKRTMIYLLVAAVIIALLVAGSLIQKRKINRKLQSVNELILRQNEKLTDLNYEKNSLISIVSHDLGLPFATIKMWSQVIGAGNNNLDAEQHKALGRIIDSTTKGEELIKNILDVEKAEVNQQPLQIEEFDVARLLEGLVGDFRPSAAMKNIELYYTAPASPIIMVSDMQRITRICQNLISNAIKYTPQGKSVSISVSEIKENIQISVNDEGVGIEKDELPRIFSKYSKISSLPTNGENSHGLGLSIVRRIVQELNGSITCESELGKGSLFIVRIRK